MDGGESISATVVAIPPKDVANNQQVYAHRCSYDENGYLESHGFFYMSASTSGKAKARAEEMLEYGLPQVQALPQRIDVAALAWQMLRKCNSGNFNIPNLFQFAPAADF